MTLTNRKKMTRFLSLTFSLICLLAFQTNAQVYKNVSGIDARVTGHLAVTKSLAIGATSGTALTVTNTGASIDCKLATKFILPNRGTTTQLNALTGMTEGALFYNTTLDNLSVYNGSAWQYIGAAAAGGSITSSGAYGITLTATATTGVTLPTSGTLYGTATGSITSANLAGSLTDETGTGVAVLATSPTLVTPALGVATATSLNGATISTTTGTLTLANSSALVTSGANSITLTSSGATNVTLPTSGTLVNDAVASLSSLTSIGLLTALSVDADVIRLRNPKTPASASATGNTGDIAWDASYIYICTATDTWERVAIATW